MALRVDFLFGLVLVVFSLERDDRVLILKKKEESHEMRIDKEANIYKKNCTLYYSKLVSNNPILCVCMWIYDELMK